MEVSAMRSKLKECYRGAPKWVDRVSKMPDKQVIAIYYRMLRDGRLS